MMFTTALKIYLLTNVVFLLGLCFYFFPEGIIIGLFAAPIAFSFSAPLILFIAGIFWILNLSKLPPVFCWILFVLSIAGMAYLPFYWYTREYYISDEMKSFIVCAYIGVLTSIIVFRRTIHSFFLHDQTLKTNVKREPWSA